MATDSTPKGLRKFKFERQLGRIFNEPGGRRPGSHRRAVVTGDRDFYAVQEGSARCRRHDGPRDAAWLHITGQDTKHSGKAWYAAVRRLSPIVLGHELDARRGADRRSVRIKLENGSSVVRKIPNPDAVAHAMVAGWPIRPEGYDFGEPIDCPSY